MKIFSLFSVCICVVISGCSVTSKKVYDGVEKPPEHHAVLSSLGLYKEDHLSLIVTAISGKDVDTNRTSEFLLLPGDYTIKIRALHDLKGLAFISWKEATLEVPLHAVAGHTYIPKGYIKDQKISVDFSDLGISYPRGCLPLRQAFPQRSDISVPSGC